MLKAVKEEQQQNNKRRGGSLRLMYYTCPLVGFSVQRIPDRTTSSSLFLINNFIRQSIDS